jgi:hypothetical protein
MEHRAGSSAGWDVTGGTDGTGALPGTPAGGWLPSVVSRVPSIVYQDLPGAGWSEMSKVRLD